MKAIIAFLIAAGFLWFIDDHFNRGRYTQGARQMVHEISKGRL